MEPTQILPALDMSVLQEKANEYAMKGAIESIKEYYSGYNSPFRKKIDEELKKQEISWSLDIPNIMAIINDSLVQEMQQIANVSVTNTYIPLIKKFFTRVDKEIKFSEILKEFIECVEPEDSEDCEVSVEKDSKYEWLKVVLRHKDNEYELTFHEDYDSKKQGLSKYSILSLPYGWRDTQQSKMKVTMDQATVELPFNRDLLKDKFCSYIARIIICESVITMDTHDFDESMFPERCHCH